MLQRQRTSYTHAQILLTSTSIVHTLIALDTVSLGIMTDKLKSRCGVDINAKDILSFTELLGGHSPTYSVTRVAQLV
jgi:hypothetical protein